MSNPHWKEFFHQLNPAFRTPSRDEIGGSLLDEEAAMVEAQMMARFSKAGKKLTLAVDGWVNIAGHHVLNFVVCDPEPMFLDSVFVQERHTGDVIAREIMKQLTSVGAEHFTAIVTDNAANMRAACKIVLGEHPNMIAIGCVSHGLNLMLEDFMNMPSLSTFLKQVKLIVRTINNKSILRNAVEGDLRESLKLPVATR